MAVKASDVRKAIKDCEVKVEIISGRFGGTFNAEVSLVYARGHGDPADGSIGRLAGEVYLTMEFQANDALYPGNIGPEIQVHESERGIKRLVGVGYFYAGRVECDMDLLSGSGRPSRNPERALAFRKVLTDTIETFNLRHVHPECELSQIMAALRILGAGESGWRMMEWNRPGYTDLQEFNRTRRLAQNALEGRSA